MSGRISPALLLPFEKWHGAGNDFVIADARSENLASMAAVIANESARVSAVTAALSAMVRALSGAAVILIASVTKQLDVTTTSLLVVPALAAALQVCRRSKVDQIIVIGDLFEDGRRIEETCRLLTEAQAIGVWGNHDFGLSYCPDPSDIENYSAVVTDFFAALKPNMGVADCHFSHCEPWQDATTLDGLWYFEGAPDRHGNLARIFDAVPHRLIFFGHFHK